MLLALRSLWERITGPPTEGRIISSVDDLNRIASTVAMTSRIVPSVAHLSRITGTVAITSRIIATVEHPSRILGSVE